MAAGDATIREKDKLMPILPTFDDVTAAAARLAGHVHRTPVLTSRTMNDETGAHVFFKCENFQRMGAFKFRGGFNALSRFDDRQRKAGVVTFSSGNHAQAIALSARLLGIPATIIMPHDAPASKMAATRGYGGNVVVYDRYTEDREAIGRKLAEGTPDTVKANPEVIRAYLGQDHNMRPHL